MIVKAIKTTTIRPPAPPSSRRSPPSSPPRRCKHRDVLIKSQSAGEVPASDACSSHLAQDMFRSRQVLELEWGLFASAVCMVVMVISAVALSVRRMSETTVPPAPVPESHESIGRQTCRS